MKQTRVLQLENLFLSRDSLQIFKSYKETLRVLKSYHWMRIELMDQILHYFFFIKTPELNHIETQEQPSKDF